MCSVAGWVVALSLALAVAEVAREEEAVVGETPGCYIKGERFGSQTLLVGITNPMTDIRSPSSCQRRCQATPNCGVFGYFPKTKTCFFGAKVDLKNVVANKLMVPDPDAIAGPVQCKQLSPHCVEMPSRDFPGATVDLTQRAWPLGFQPPNLQCLPKQWARNGDQSCLTPQPAGCMAIQDLAICMNSLDASEKVSEKGLSVHGEPCVWCDDGPCTSDSPDSCYPHDYLRRGEGRAFTSKVSAYRVAECSLEVVQPQAPGELTCLTPVVMGCTSLRDKQSCLSSKEGRQDIRFKSHSTSGQPCVWCNGAICHSPLAMTTPQPLAQAPAPDAVCEVFDVLFNGEGETFLHLQVRDHLEVAGCQDGTQKAVIMAAPTAPYFGTPDESLYSHELALCPGEAPVVLEDRQTGWQGTCLGLDMKVPPANRSCALDCGLNASCSSWQELQVNGAKQCWQGLGHDCYAYPGARVILGAQRLLHGSYRVLMDVTGYYVPELLQIFPASRFVERAESVKNCNHTCLSLITCQVWTFSTASGCMIDTGQLPYPITTKVFNTEAPEATGVVSGEYILRMCAAMVDQIRHLKQDGGYTSLTHRAAAHIDDAPPPTTTTLPSTTTPVNLDLEPHPVPQPGAPDVLSPTTPTPPTTAPVTSQPAKQVEFHMLVQGISYEALTSHAALQESFEDEMTEIIASNVGVDKSAVALQLASGSVLVKADVTPPTDDLDGFMLRMQGAEDSIAQSATYKLSSLPGIEQATDGPIAVDVMGHKEAVTDAQSGTGSWQWFVIAPLLLLLPCAVAAAIVLFMRSRKKKMEAGSSEEHSLLDSEDEAAPPAAQGPFDTPHQPLESQGQMSAAAPPSPSSQSSLSPQSRPVTGGLSPASPGSAPYLHGPPMSSPGFASRKQHIFAATVDRSQGGSLGIEVDYAIEGNAVIVANIGPTGLIPAWNAQNPEAQIRHGDYFLEINGHRANTTAMMAEMRQNQVLNLIVVPGMMP